MEYVIIFVTVKGGTEAERIARALLEKKLAACCNIVKDIRSLYWWQEKICDDAEVLLVIKTRQDLFADLEAAVKACHSYSVPEIIALPVVAASAAYLTWMGENLKEQGRS